MPPLPIQQEYALQKQRQDKIERDFVFKRIPKPPSPRPVTRSFDVPYTDYEKYVIWLVD